MNKKLAVSCVFLILFLLVLTGVILGLARPVDNVINSSFAGLENKSLTFISSILDIVFDSYVMIGASILIAFLLFILRRRKLAWMFGLIMIANGVIISLIKQLVARVRPLGLIDASGYSFPSGHATTAVVFFGLLIYMFRKRRSFLINLICVLMMIIISLSRLYLRVHWGSDVVAGMLLGLGILFLGLSFDSRDRV